MSHFRSPRQCRLGWPGSQGSGNIFQSGGVSSLGLAGGGSIDCRASSCGDHYGESGGQLLKIGRTLMIAL